MMGLEESCVSPQEVFSRIRPLNSKKRLMDFAVLPATVTLSPKRCGCLDVWGCTKVLQSGGDGLYRRFPGALPFAAALFFQVLLHADPGFRAWGGGAACDDQTALLVW
jgi:hypothetical protein